MTGEATGMKPAPLDPLARHVLRALYELAELDVAAHVGVLGRALGRPATDVARVLLVLDARGLVSAQRARLTLLGLAHAARLPALGLVSTCADLVRASQASQARGKSARADDRCAGESARLGERQPQVAATLLARERGRLDPALASLRRCAGDEQDVPKRALATLARTRSARFEHS